MTFLEFESVPDDFTQVYVPRDELVDHYFAREDLLFWLRVEAMRSLPWWKRWFIRMDSIPISEDELRARIEESLRPVLDAAAHGGQIYFFCSPVKPLDARAGYLVKRNDRVVFTQVIMES